MRPENYQLWAELLIGVAASASNTSQNAQRGDPGRESWSRSRMANTTINALSAAMSAQ
jgi:hypothetical protein